MNDERIERILAQFDLPTQQLAAWRAFGNGHINDTYRVDLVDCPQAYVLQRINTAVFPDANILMDNIVAVTSFLKKRIVARGGDPLRETVTLVPTTNKKWFVTDDGDVFRVMLLIPDAVSHENATTPELFYQSAVAFGGFQKELADFDATQLTPVIDKFHDTRDRLATFQRILAADTHNRAKDAEPEIAFILERATECAFIADRLDDGSLPLRVTHNDTKLNNVLLDPQTSQPICVLDLDTVMPGSALYDFGDAIRFGANTAAEDERDLSKVQFSLPLFAAFVDGFLHSAGDILTAEEIAWLPYGAKIITLEQGIRFLGDYLNGDTYFKTHYTDHNLVRARTQLKLVQEMEHHWTELHQIVQKSIAPK